MTATGTMVVNAHQATARGRLAHAGSAPRSPHSLDVTMSHDEMDSRTELQLAGPKQIARLLGRALRLRCPNCGGGPVLQHWLKLRVRCGTCGLRLERGEHDYFTGSMMFNFVISGLLFALSLAVVLAATWPSVPWDAIQYVWGPLIVVLPLLLFPFSKLLWLAFDLMLRPVTPEELEWHRAATGAWSSERSAPRDR
jgi:uncharacterized protein (DUF983 family)